MTEIHNSFRAHTLPFNLKKNQNINIIFVNKHIQNVDIGENFHHETIFFVACPKLTKSMAKMGFQKMFFKHRFFLFLHRPAQMSYHRMDLEIMYMCIAKTNSELFEMSKHLF